MVEINEIVTVLQECGVLINGGADNNDRVLILLDSVLHVIENSDYEIPNRMRVTVLLESVLDAVTNSIRETERTSHCDAGPGRPRLKIESETIEKLLRTGFTLTAIAKIVGVSRWTLYNRLREQGISPSAKYSIINDEDLVLVITDILREFPNTGYKRMQGYLRSRGVIIPQLRLRDAVKSADPEGVFQRTVRSRIIVRRQYFVKYSNEIWHLDTHMKLIRWKIVIRGAIDGKSRLVPYLEAGNNNRSDNNLRSFLSGVDNWGLPLRTRSDKGMENILIARFMLETRGTNRGSHICGRSVHNQRIERYWGDLFQGMLWYYYVTFSEMEAKGMLDINNALHMTVLHFVFLPRINTRLQDFVDGWNEHPISTEHNWSPKQIYFANLYPKEQDFVDERNVTDWNLFLQQEDDLQVFEDDENDVIRNPVNDIYRFSANQILLLDRMDLQRPSNSNGMDVYMEALRICTNDL